jgi:hypothetical protein
MVGPDLVPWGSKRRLGLGWLGILAYLDWSGD